MSLSASSVGHGPWGGLEDATRRSEGDRSHRGGGEVSKNSQRNARGRTDACRTPSSPTSEKVGQVLRGHGSREWAAKSPIHGSLWPF